MATIAETPNLTTVPPSESTWLDRIDRWCESFGDTLNPILVKETRQALKSRQFVMTFSVLLFAAIMLTASFIQAASQDEVMKEIEEAASAIGDYSVDQKDKAIAEAKELMDKLDKSMEEAESSMKENWDSMEDSAKQNYELSKEEMDKQRKELADWLEKMQDSSADAWDDTQKGFADAHDSLSETWQKVKEHMAQE